MMQTLKAWAQAAQVNNHIGASVFFDQLIKACEQDFCYVLDSGLQHINSHAAQLVMDFDSTQAWHAAFEHASCAHLPIRQLTDLSLRDQRRDRDDNQTALVRLSSALHSAIDALTLQSKKNLPYDRLGLTFTQLGGETIVRKDGIGIALVSSERISRPQLLTTIATNATKVGAQVMQHFNQTFIDHLELPSPYVATHDVASDLRWIQTNGSRSSSIYIGNPTVDIKEPDQLGAEFRIFLDRPRATLFISYGPQYNFLSQTLVNDEQRFLSAPTYLELAQKVMQTFREVTHEYLTDESTHDQHLITQARPSVR